MTGDMTNSLQLTKVIQASPEEVFEAFTRPDQLKAWSCPEGGKVDTAEVDLRVGGALLIVMNMGEGKIYHARGVFKEIVPGRKLVYTWDWDEEESRMGDTLITVDLTPIEEGTEVVFTHELFPTVELKNAHEQGWTSCLDRLERLFPGR